MNDKLDEMHFFYDDGGLPRQGSSSYTISDDADATKYWKTHNYNHTVLQHFHRNGTAEEKIQAAKEMKIAERKMKFWSQHPNFNEDEAKKHTASLKGTAPVAGRADAAAVSKQSSIARRHGGKTIKEGSAADFLKFRAKKQNAAKTSDDLVADYLTKGGKVLHGDTRKMSNRLSASKAIRNSQDFDKELRIAASYLKKKEVKEDVEMDEAINPNLQRLLALRARTGQVVKDHVKAKIDNVVNTTSGETSKDVRDFLEKGGRVQKIVKGKKNYRWERGEPIRKPRKGIGEETENVNEISRGMLSRYLQASLKDTQSLLPKQSFPGAIDGTNTPMDPKMKARLEKRSKGRERGVYKLLRTVKEDKMDVERAAPAQSKPLSQIVAKPARKYNEYQGSTKDERKIMKMYRDHTVLIPDYNGNGDDVFKAAKIKRDDKRVAPGEDEKKYAEWNGDVPVVENFLHDTNLIPTNKIPESHRDGTKHVVAVHTYDGDELPQRYFLGDGENSSGKPNLVGLHSNNVARNAPEHQKYNGEYGAKVFDTYGAAHDHVTKLLSDDASKSHWKRNWYQYSIHPKRNEEATTAEYEDRKNYGAKAHDHASKYLKTHDASELDKAKQAVSMMQKSTHPIKRTRGSSQGDWLHGRSEFEVRGTDKNPEWMNHAK